MGGGGGGGGLRGVKMGREKGQGLGGQNVGPCLKGAGGRGHERKCCWNGSDERSSRAVVFVTSKGQGRVVSWHIFVNRTYW